MCPGAGITAGGDRLGVQSWLGTGGAGWAICAPLGSTTKAFCAVGPTGTAALHALKTSPAAADAARTHRPRRRGCGPLRNGTAITGIP
jgi:hypothetical protein